MEALDYLNRVITDGMTLEELVGAFEGMCRIPIADDLILFETGRFSFTGKPMFYISLVRQFPNADEEYVQIHLDILYPPSPLNRFLSTSVWSDQLEQSIFAYIRSSKAFAQARRDQIARVEVYLDET